MESLAALGPNSMRLAPPLPSQSELSLATGIPSTYAVAVTVEPSAKKLKAYPTSTRRTTPPAEAVNVPRPRFRSRQTAGQRSAIKIGDIGHY
jgi:hypothetical protein